jgi:hypothetical protein
LLHSISLTIPENAATTLVSSRRDNDVLSCQCAHTLRPIEK